MTPPSDLQRTVADLVMSWICELQTMSLGKIDKRPYTGTKDWDDVIYELEFLRAISRFLTNDEHSNGIIKQIHEEAAICIRLIAASN